MENSDWNAFGHVSLVRIGSVQTQQQPGWGRVEQGYWRERSTGVVPTARMWETNDLRIDGCSKILLPG